MNSAQWICQIASLKGRKVWKQINMCRRELLYEFQFMHWTDDQSQIWMIGWMLQNFKFKSRVFTIYRNFLHGIVADQQVWKWQTIFWVLKRAAAEKNLMMNKWTWGRKKSDIYTIEFNIDSITRPAINARHAERNILSSENNQKVDWWSRVNSSLSKFFSAWKMNSHR